MLTYLNSWTEVFHSCIVEVSFCSWILSAMTYLKLPTALCLPRARVQMLWMCSLMKRYNASLLKNWGRGNSSQFNSEQLSSCVELATWKIIMCKVNVTSCKSTKCPERENVWSSGGGGRLLLFLIFCKPSLCLKTKNSKQFIVVAIYSQVWCSPTSGDRFLQVLGTGD